MSVRIHILITNSQLFILNCHMSYRLTAVHSGLTSELPSHSCLFWIDIWVTNSQLFILYWHLSYRCTAVHSVLTSELPIHSCLFWYDIWATDSQLWIHGTICKDMDSWMLIELPAVSFRIHMCTANCQLTATNFLDLTQLELQFKTGSLCLKWTHN